MKAKKNHKDLADEFPALISRSHLPAKDRRPDEFFYVGPPYRSMDGVRSIVFEHKSFKKWGNVCQ